MLTLGVIGEAITSAGIWIVSGVYHVAAWSFQLFLVLASGQLLETDIYQVLISNFYVILGIIMLFFLSFTLLKSMVNPDDQNKGTSSARKVLINLVTSAIIMALLPTIFTFLFDFQTSVISNQNTIGKFFGYGGTGEADSPTNNLDKVKTGAFQIVNGVYTAFFNVNSSNCDIISEASLEECQKIPQAKKDFGGEDKTLLSAINYVNADGSFGIYTNFSKSVSEDEIDFNFILSLVGGVLLAYVGISFCIDMAVRLVKLVFYQLIAPIPIFARVIPDTKLSNSFNDWLKVTLTCYMEVFIRIFILYFAIFLCTNMLKSPFIREQVYEYGGFIALFAKAFILMGIIIFMRQAPKLLSDITGIDSGNMKLGIRDKIKDAGVFTAGAAVGGGLTALTRNAFNAKDNIKNKWGETKGFRGKASLIAGGIASTFAGGVSGTVRSAKSGWQAGSVTDMKNAAGTGAKRAVDARDIRASYKAKHGDTLGGVIKGRIVDAWDTGKRWAGINNIEEYQQTISSMENVNSKVDAVADEARKVLASNAKTGKHFDYGLYKFDADGNKLLDANGKVVLRSDEDVTKQYGVNLDYSLDNYRTLENAIQRAESSGGSVYVRNVNGTLEFIDPNAKNTDGTPKYTADEVKTFDVDTLSRMQNLYVTNYSEAVANQAFKSDKKYSDWAEDIRLNGDYKEVAAMSAIRAKAEDARNELSRVLNSEAIERANKASYDYYYNKAFNSFKESLGEEQAKIRAKEETDKAMSNILLNAETINGDLRITDRTALNYYGSAVKEVKSEYLTEISKIQQKEKDKNGK